MIAVLPRRIGLRGIVVALTLSIVAAARRAVGGQHPAHLAAAARQRRSAEHRDRARGFGRGRHPDRNDHRRARRVRRAARARRARHRGVRQPRAPSDRPPAGLVGAAARGSERARDRASLPKAMSTTPVRSRPAGRRRSAATQKPVVSKLFEMPGVAGHFVMIAVPIVRDGKVTLALGARVRSDSLGAVLRQQQAPPNGAVVAGRLGLPDGRPHQAGRELRRHARSTEAFIDLLSRIPEGSWTTDTRDGTPVYAAFSRSALTGMTVGAGACRARRWTARSAASCGSSPAPGW